MRPEARGTPANSSSSSHTLRAYSGCAKRARSRTIACEAPSRSSLGVSRRGDRDRPDVGERAAPLDNEDEVGHEALALRPRFVRGCEVSRNFPPDRS